MSRVPDPVELWMADALASIPLLPAPGSPFEGCPSLASRDLDEVRDNITRVFCAHRLQVATAGQRLDTRLSYRPLERIGLGCLSYGATVDIDPGSLPFYLLQWPTRGGEIVQAGDHEIHSCARVATLINPGQRFHMRHLADSEKLFVRIEPRALERVAGQLTPDRRPGPITFSSALALDEPDLQSLRQCLGWLFAEAAGGSLLSRPLIAARLEDTLLLTLLHSLDPEASAAGAEVRLVTPGFVRRAEDFMAAHAGEPLTITAIAAVVGVSSRSLYAGFRRYRGVSPMKHLRLLRLDRVHQVLSAGEGEGARDDDGFEGREREGRGDRQRERQQGGQRDRQRGGQQEGQREGQQEGRAPGPDISVTETALRWGFGHLGEFAGEYRARFGERPSDTLRRARRR